MGRLVGCFCSYESWTMLTSCLIPFHVYHPICMILYFPPPSSACLEQNPYNYGPGQPFQDPAIMSARLASPTMARGVADFSSPPSVVDSAASQHLGYGPPPGLQFVDGHTSPSGFVNASGSMAYLDVSQAGSVQRESSSVLSQGSVSQVRVPSAVPAVRKLYHRP